MSLAPRSLDSQLRDTRKEKGDFVVSHIDTCLPSYLGDHHNRDGELLLGVPVNGASTVGEVLDGLLDEFRQIGWDLGESRKGFDYDKAKAAIEALAHANDLSPALFDSSLDLPQEDDDFAESCQAWFLIHWEVPEDEEEEES